MSHVHESFSSWADPDSKVSSADNLQSYNIYIVHTIKNNVAVRINEFLTQENNSQIKAAFRNFSKEKRVL